SRKLRGDERRRRGSPVVNPLKPFRLAGLKADKVSVELMYGTASFSGDYITRRAKGNAPGISRRN
ncbi:MAG: hypothetical protein AAB356_03105, partial [Deltaproteobacteria bacterium]